MGVDANLYLPLQLSAEHIAYSLARAMGEEVRLVEGEENVFSARDYLRTTEHSPASMWRVEIPTHNGTPHCQPSLHLSNSPFGPCWCLIARARPEVLAIFRTVGERLGGFLVWQDCYDDGHLYGPPGNEECSPYPWQAAHDAACHTPVAHIKPEDISRAAY